MKRSILLVALLATSGFAFADAFRYDFLQLDYGTGDYTNSSIDCVVWELNGSLGITNRLRIVGSYQTADFDYIADAIEWKVGLGVNSPLSERFDVVASVSYVNLDIDPLIGQCHNCRPGFEDDGYGLAVGVRSSITKRFEINAGVSYIDLSDTGDDTGLDGGVMFNWTDSFSVGLFGTWGGVASYQASARLYFK
jgi:hypothetical protein